VGSESWGQSHWPWNTVHTPQNTTGPCLLWPPYS